MTKKEPLSLRIIFLEDILKDELKSRRYWREQLKEDPNNELAKLQLESYDFQIESTKRLIREALSV